jgi:hypothetical protein
MKFIDHIFQIPIYYYTITNQNDDLRMEVESLFNVIHSIEGTEGEEEDEEGGRASNESISIDLLFVCLFGV